MLRKIIRIDEEKCNGCGACASACHEGAIDIVDGKAKLAREHYCDGLGDCLPNCPMGAITFEEREAPAYDEAAVLAAKLRQQDHACPSAAPRCLNPSNTVNDVKACSQLAQWPCQIKLVPLSAPYYSGADILIAADCTAYAYANFHNEIMRGKVTLIGCPKLDGADYSAKLAEIFRLNDIHSVTVARMEVPCCGGLEQAVKKALSDCGKDIPCKVMTFLISGGILD